MSDFTFERRQRLEGKEKEDKMGDGKMKAGSNLPRARTGSPNIRLFSSDDGPIQVQLQGLANDNIWVIRTDERGIQFHQPASPPSHADVGLALELAIGILKVAGTQMKLYGGPGHIDIP